MMTTYNYGILSMQKTYNSRLECPQGRDLKTRPCDHVFDTASGRNMRQVHHSTRRIICIISISDSALSSPFPFPRDLPYTRIGVSNLVVVNPYKTLANVNDL
ncbi:hypothetical protein PILCRDRAFT_797435 [Piloderma croceum F 1598]|uniref:Uncharacterized protein n=1 Tax=Piloderma croceum (strain F 1598) TaxID=765440 RepID=A0A0C3BGN2_PILCF|nr:hypothetical protein PILCRDRAFT_797435 [Piloderma croceum F 1598]